MSVRIIYTEQERSTIRQAFARQRELMPRASFAEVFAKALLAIPAARRGKVALGPSVVPWLGVASRNSQPRRDTEPRRRVVLTPNRAENAAPAGRLGGTALERLAAVIRELKADYAAVGAEIDTAIDAAVEDVIGRVRAAHEHVRALRSISTKEAPMPPSEVTPRTHADAPPRRRDPLTSVARRRRKVRSGAQAVRNAGPAPKPTRGASSKSQPEDRAASSSSDGETDPSRTGSAPKRVPCRAHAETGHEPSCSSCRIAEIRAAHERVSHA